jgi:hypothetical protein
MGLLVDLDSSAAAAAAPAWVEAGDYELNVAGVCGAPTLRPSPGLERCLTLDLGGKNQNPSPSEIRLGVHLHAFYLTEADQIIGLLQQALPPFDLLITTDTGAKQHALAEILARYSSPRWQQRFDIRVIPNRGRNVIPLLRDGVPFLGNCQLVLHLHTKRTIHKSFGPDWLNDLLAGLIGDADRVGALIQAFSTDPGLGLVMPLPSELIRPYLNWGANFEIASCLVQALWPGRALDIQAPLVFPPGMMFWARPAALAPLVGALAVLEPLPPEPLLIDGTPLHALERLTAHACEVAGLRWALAGARNRHLDPGEDGARAVQQAVSVWDPQPEAYLEGVSALGIIHRQLQHNLEERERQLQAILNHRDSLELSLTERDRGLAERDAALADCRQQLQQAEQAHQRQLQAILDHRDSLELSLRERERGLAERDTALSDCRQQLQQTEEEQQQRLQSILDHQHSLEMFLAERERGLAQRDADLSESWRELLSNQNAQQEQMQAILAQWKELKVQLAERERCLADQGVELSECRQELLLNQETQGQQLLTILEQGRMLAASLEDCRASVRDLEAKQLAMRQTQRWWHGGMLRRLGNMLK